MAKFIKSIFQTSERRKSKYEEGEDDKSNVALPLDGRRKLSISRSGRMKQANRKRHSLSLEVYNQEIQSYEKCTTTEYHTNENKKTVESNITSNLQRSQSIELKSPEEEIDSAFEILDQVECLK